MKRLRTCPDLDCETIYVSGSHDYVDNGGSCFCYGKLKDEHTHKVKEITHKNHYSMCIYTPPKGITRYFIDHTDALIMKLGADLVLKDYHG